MSFYYDWQVMKLFVARTASDKFFYSDIHDENHRKLSANAIVFQEFKNPIQKQFLKRI